MELPELILFFFIVNLGIALGAGLYETRMVLPKWFPKTPGGYTVDAVAMTELDSGRNFWGPTTTLPLTLMTLANVYFAFQSTGEIRTWWLTAAGLALAERLLTFIFFIPTVIRLLDGAEVEQTDPARRTRTISLWLTLNQVRIAMTLAAMMLGMWALAI